MATANTSTKEDEAIEAAHAAKLHYVSDQKPGIRRKRAGDSFTYIDPHGERITDEVIVVRHGLIRQRIKLADITEVRPTRSPLSAPALSLDRIAIRFGEGMFKSAMLSPADQSGFLAELAQRAGLVREGDALVRRK